MTVACYRHDNTDGQIGPTIQIASVVLVGRLVEVKGCEFLIQSIKLVKSQSSG